MAYRPQIQNGQVVKRPRTATSQHYNSSPQYSASRRYPNASATATMAPAWSGISFGELAHNGLGVLGLDEKISTTEAKTRAAGKTMTRLGLMGGLISFVFSLRDHFKAHAMGREEVGMRRALDQSQAEQRGLEYQLGQAVSPQAIEQAARQYGLAPVELDLKNKVIVPAKSTSKREQGKH
jgi:hypothetical protein